MPLNLQDPGRDFVKVTADLTLAAWNTVAAHEILQVTGDVRVIILPKIRVAAVGASGTYALGIEGSTSAFIGATAVAAMLINTAWLSTTPAQTYALTSILDRIVTNGADIGYTIATTAASAGVIDFYCWWEPLLPGSSVAAGTGIAL
jgi:hypothetical protein